MVQIPFGPPGLEPWPGYPDPYAELADRRPMLAVEIDGATLYVDDEGRWFSRPADAAVRDRVGHRERRARLGDVLTDPAARRHGRRRGRHRPPGPRPHSRARPQHAGHVAPPARHRRLVRRRTDPMRDPRTIARLEPASMNAQTVAADVGTLLVIALDGGRVYLDDRGNLFALPEDAAVRDRFVDALNASGARPGSPPLPLLYAMQMAETAIAHLGRGRILNPPQYTDADWDIPHGAHA